MDWRFLLSLFFAVIVSIFALQNANTVDIRFLNLQLSMSLALVILVSAVIGAVSVFLLSIIRFFRLNKKIKELNKVITNLKEDINDLKEDNEQCQQSLALTEPDVSSPDIPQ